MLNRKLAPPFQKTESLILPKPTEVDIASGVTLFLIPGIQQNVAKLEVVFSAGKWFESRTGLSQFTSLLLEKGTNSRSAEQIANTLDYFGASLEISNGFDYVSVALYSLKSQWAEVFPVFLDILREPSFPQREWELSREIFLQNLKINNEKTSYRASALMRKNVFGASHPYGSSVEANDVAALSTGEFKDFFARAFSIHSVYGVGNFTDAEIQSIKDGVGAMPMVRPLEASPVLLSVEAFRERVEKEGSVQSSIRLGKKSGLKTDPDYFDMLIFNHLLGGFFGSRLMKNIREEKGLTYGIYSGLNTFARGGLFIIGADVNKVNLDLAVDEIKSELKKLRTVAVGDEELLLAKNHFVGSLQADMANLFSVIEKVKNIHLNKLPASYYQDLVKRVDEVSAEDILRIADTYFSEDSLFEVAVG